VLSSATILVDGLPGDHVSINDRGLQYGDGVFRTLRLRAGQPLWWTAQLAKLDEDCQRLDLPPVSRAAWQADLARLATHADEAVLKLIVTRGLGERGYRPSPRPKPTRIAMIAPAPVFPAALDQSGVATRVCRLRLGHQPALAGVKHLNRLENVLAQAEWRDPEIAEGLLFDQDDHLVGGTKSNIFLVHGATLRTPALGRCGVAGVTRARIIEIVRQAGLNVEESDTLCLDDVQSADEVILCNSLIGAWWVNRLESRRWSAPKLRNFIAERLDGEA
jgi:4-amino-4-deoxychorismate lyase